MKNTKDFEGVLDFLANNYQKCPYDYPLNIYNEPDKFGYFEAIMGKDGTVYDAPNGHQRGIVMMLARDLGVSAEEVEARAMHAGLDYLEWLIEQAQAILLWHNFYMGKPNEQQILRIEELKSLGHLHRKAVSRR